MGADNSSNIESKQAPALIRVTEKNLLADAPSRPPKYPVTVKTAAGSDMVLGNPDVTRGLIALMDQHAVDGGAASHWGGGAAFAEIMSAIHGVMFSEKDRPWHQAYNFINDAGHTENGVYALRANLGFDGMTFGDLRHFRDIDCKFTGHGEAHLNPEGVLVSNGPLGSGIPQAEGLCLGDKALGNDRVTLCTLSDGAAMEGEAREAFASIPGLAAKGKLNPFVLIISDNNAKLSGRIDADSFSMTPSLKAMETLGWSLIPIEKGHDIQTVFTAVEQSIQQARANPGKPVCILVKTVKGQGVKFTEEKADGGHGYPLKKKDGKIVEFINEIFRGNPPEEFEKWAAELAAPEANTSDKAEPPVKRMKVQVGISKAAIRAVEDGFPVYSISADLAGSTGLAGFQKAYPERTLDIGVAEANMVSIGNGLSLNGLIPIVDTFTQFGVTKGNLPLVMSALSKAPIIGLFSHTGFQDAADGASHQATHYFAAVSAIPHTRAVCCACADEAEVYLYEAVKYISGTRKAGEAPDSVILFIGRENYPQYLQENAEYEWGKAQILKDGSDVALVACGPMVEKAQAAAEALAERGVQAAVINNAFINRPDIESIGKIVADCDGKLVTIEDHQVTGGMGAQLIHALTLDGHKLQAKSLGIKGQFGQSAYTADALYEKHQLNVETIVKAARELI